MSDIFHPPMENDGARGEERRSGEENWGGRKRKRREGERREGERESQREGAGMPVGFFYLEDRYEGWEVGGGWLMSQKPRWSVETHLKSKR